MFHHVKELQFNARVSGPDPKFAALLLEQFGGGNGELKAAMQYFTQAFSCRQSYPEHYDMLMDIATEEFSHLEIVGATITMLLGNINGQLKNAVETKDLMERASSADVTKLASGGRAAKEQMIHDALIHPEFLVLSAGGPAVTNSQGVPWQGSYVNANGDLTVDLRSNIGAESRAKIVYEYLMQFTDDPLVRETLGFLMTREISHFGVFSAALATIQPNFPPGILQGDPRYTHAYFNMSNGASVRGPWNEGQGPWMEGEQWEYVENPVEQVRKTNGLTNMPVGRGSMTPDKAQKLEGSLSKQRTKEVLANLPDGENQWTSYPQRDVNPPAKKKAS